MIGRRLRRQKKKQKQICRPLQLFPCPSTVSLIFNTLIFDYLLQQPRTKCSQEYRDNTTHDQGVQQRI